VALFVSDGTVCFAVGTVSSLAVTLFLWGDTVFSELVSLAARSPPSCLGGLPILGNFISISSHYGSNWKRLSSCGARAPALLRSRRPGVSFGYLATPRNEVGQSRGSSEWKSIEQRVPITWTACHLGGQRPWFVCSVYSGGRYCGRRVAVFYGAGELFACRRCYGLAYASQQESAHHRGLGKAQKIRMGLGGSANKFDDFPDKPKKMHWRTYERLRHTCNIAQARCTLSLTRFIDRLDRKVRVRR
jgi:hypothetical protein